MTHYSRFAARFDEERLAQVQGIRDYLSGRHVVYATLKWLQNLGHDIEDVPLSMFRQDEDKKHRYIPIMSDQAFDILQENLESAGLQVSLRNFDWITVTYPENLAALLAPFADLETEEKARELPRAWQCLTSEPVQYHIYELVRNCNRQKCHPRINEILKQFDPDFEYSQRWIWGLTDDFVTFYRQQGYHVVQDCPWDFYFQFEPQEMSENTD